MPQIAAFPNAQIRATPRYFYGGAPNAERRDILMPGDMPGGRFFRPAFTLRWGRRGRGKTLTLAAEGHHFRQAYIKKGLRRGWDPKTQTKQNGTYPWLVVSNFQNSFADVSRPYLVEELTEYPGWAWNLKIQIDEFALYAHRRKWQLTSNLNLESFITQIRKRSIEPSAATQFPQRLDSDIVEQIDLFIDCDIEYNGCGHPEHTFCAVQRVHDWWGQWTGKTWRKPWPPNPWEYDYLKWFHNCRLFFGGYVTEEIHSPIWLKDNQKNRIRLKQWGEETDLEEDLADFQRQEALAAAHGPVDAAVLEDLRAGGEYTPDMSVGAPGADQLALFLQDKASRQPGRLLSLGRYVREAQGINPEVDGLRALVMYCRGQGWRVERGGNTTAWVAHIP